MKPTLALSAALASLALVAGAEVAGTSLSQIDIYDHMFTQAKGDSEVVAVVQGKKLLRGYVRKPTEYYQAEDESLTENQPTKLSIVALVDDLIIVAEVERREFLPENKETTEYMHPHKEACLGEHGAHCRAEITSRGIQCGPIL